MTPEAADATLVDILAARAEFTEDDLYAALDGAGVPFPVADQAYKFTQIAWGRSLLDGLGIKFAPEYVRFNASGEVIESGQLANQPYFAAALAAACRNPPPVGLPQFALMSADVAAVNDALKSGSKPEDLVTGPAALFLESPTQAGIERAQRLLTERVSLPAKKPRWRFW